MWGIEPASLIKRVLASREVSRTAKVLDLGCGEGKNAAALAGRGCDVIAVDCSAAALRNGQNAFAGVPIRWVQDDVINFDCGRERYDLVIAYGLFHCLESVDQVASLIARMKVGTRSGGLNVVCSFNDRSHDLSAHPGMKPLLLAHPWYMAQYEDWEIELGTDSDLHESHPHNRILHHHSLTRLLVRKP